MSVTRIEGADKDENEDFSSSDAWVTIGSYFREGHLSRLVRHQIESYNDMVNTQLPATIAMFNPVTVRSDHYYNKEAQNHELEVMITFENFRVNRPQIHENNGATKLMFPQEARLRNFTYAANTTIDMNIKYIVRNGASLENSHCFHNVLKKINIGKLPVMLKSSICLLSQYEHIDHNTTGECQYDPGGYFIINGSEKTVLGQERAAENKIYCFAAGRNSNKYQYMAEIKSVPDFRRISPKQVSMYLSCNAHEDYVIQASIPRIRKPIPLFIIFRALGVISDKDISSKIVLDVASRSVQKVLETLRGSVIEACEVYTQEDAIQYITAHAMYTPINMDRNTGLAKKREFTVNVLSNDLFPHCRTETQKIYFLGYMACKLIRCKLGWIKTNNRDSYVNKRIDLPGSLINNLYRNYFNKLVKDMQKQIIREMNTGSWKSTEDYVNIINTTNVYKIIKSTTIENGIKRSLATGDFGIKQANSNKVGVAQVLNRLTYISSLSHLRRINTPIDKSGKLVEPRKLHASTWGYICPAETPEGPGVGVVKSMAYLTHITVPSDSQALHEYVTPFVVSHDDMDTAVLYTGVKVFVNGAWMGNTETPMELYRDIKNKKYQALVSPYTSVVFDIANKELHFCTEAGRIVRPVLRIENRKVLITKDIVKRLDNRELVWDDLLIESGDRNSVIEYIDPTEQNNAFIAMNCRALRETGDNRYTHCEIDASTIFGICASCIPFPEHNQSPRNTYQCAMGKQALGVYVTNFASRMDKTAYVLSYPHRPLVDTRVMNLLKLNEIPSGMTVIVAIMVHTGYNQEDSVMMNRNSVDRGMFQATLYHTEKDEDKKLHGDDEIRCKPDASRTKGTKFGNYNKLTGQGVIPENMRVNHLDVMMGKVIPIKEARNDHTKVVKFEDLSRCHRTDEECFMDKNYIDRNGDGYSFWKGRIRMLRSCHIGDKFSSRHGQKGTVGNIIPEEDLPFTASGMKPDIIINPHAIPSRMTIAQLKETLLGKVLLELGLFGDGTAFTDLSVDSIAKELIKTGYEGNGNEVMYNGQTGEQMEAAVFIGPAFYQRLKHMVLDKAHSRAIGPMVNLTRQPAEGRARDGGLRFGEMERDCVIAHGAANFAKSRMYDVSDKYHVYVCGKCGMNAAFNNKTNVHRCKMCDNRSDFTRVNLPYACKLLFQELRTMNIAPRILTK